MLFQPGPGPGRAELRFGMLCRCCAHLDGARSGEAGRGGALRDAHDALAAVGSSWQAGSLGAGRLAPRQKDDWTTRKPCTANNWQSARRCLASKNRGRAWRSVAGSGSEWRGVGWRGLERRKEVVSRLSHRLPRIAHSAPWGGNRRGRKGGVGKETMARRYRSIQSNVNVEFSKFPININI